MDEEAMAKIDASRERLRRFAANSTDEELTRTIEGAWTAAALLAHTAFWDRRTSWQLRRCQQGNLTPSEVDLASVNEAALPQWRLVPPRAAAQEALDAATEVDSLAAGLSAELIAAMQEAQSHINYDRSNHRNEHLDQIERALGRLGNNPAR